MVPRTWWLALVMAVAGCDQVFGLSRPAGDAGDADADPILDAAPCVDPSSGPDEDGDQVSDLCDNCPQIPQAPGDFGDADLDGVGDLCDPHPGARDQVIAFINFAAPPPGFSGRADGATGGWSLNAPGSEMLLNNGAVDADYLGFFNVTLRDVTVDTELHFVAAAPPLPLHTQNVGLWVDIASDSTDPTFPTGLLFELVAVQGANSARLTNTMDGTTATSNASPELFVSGTSYRLRLGCDGQIGECIGTVQYGINATTLPPVTLSGVTTRLGGVGLRVHGDLVASFRYLAIYEGPIP